MSKFNSFSRAANLFALVSCVVALIAPTTGAQAQAQPAQRQEVPPAAIASPTPSPTPATAAATDDHDLSITANVTARELRFEVVPNPTVEFSGQPRRDTVWEAERTNLPAQIQPGVTYRDIGIRLKITSVFADIERIVAEALGEVSASDSSNNNSNANPPQTLEPTASVAPQIDNTATATIDVVPANAVLPATASTQNPRAALTKPTPPRRKNSSSNAPTRRGRN